MNLDSVIARKLMSGATAFILEGSAACPIFTVLSREATVVDAKSQVKLNSVELQLHKAKVRSMQRGAQYRSSEAPIRMQDIYKEHPPRIASVDKPHLDFLKYGKPEQVVRIRTVIEAAKKNGIGTASEISHLLNKLLIKTAIGEKWTPRLAWFAAAAIKAENQAQKVRTTGGDIEGSSKSDTKFRDIVNRVVKSRLDEIRAEFEASKPTLGEASPELAALRKRLEGHTE